MAYSMFDSPGMSVSLISGNRGIADDRCGSLRLGTLGVNVESCTLLPKRILACFLVILGDWGFQKGN